MKKLADFVLFQDVMESPVIDSSVANEDLAVVAFASRGYDFVVHCETDDQDAKSSLAATFEQCEAAHATLGPHTWAYTHRHGIYAAFKDGEGGAQFVLCWKSIGKTPAAYCIPVVRRTDEAA